MYFSYWGYLIAVNLQIYHRTFATETCKQCPETTRGRLCYEKERIVVERANDDLCQKNVKNASLISTKPIDF